MQRFRRLYVVSFIVRNVNLPLLKEAGEHYYWCSRFLRKCVRNDQVTSRRIATKIGHLGNRSKAVRNLYGVIFSAAIAVAPFKDKFAYLPRQSDFIHPDKEKDKSASSLQVFLKSIGIFIRFIRLFVTFVPVILLCPLTLLGNRCKKLWWSILLTAIEFSGPIFIKLGQWASTRRDLFPKEFCQLFSRLQRNVAPHSWYFTANQLDTAFGPEWRNFIPKIDNDRAPIGSGCVAQVYKAYLRPDCHQDNRQISKIYQKIQMRRNIWKTKVLEALEYTGFFKLFGTQDRKLDEAMQSWEQAQQMRNLEEMDGNHDHNNNLIPVAIKVLHPSIRSLLQKDLAIMEVAARFLQFIFPSLQWLNLTRCVQEFSQLMSRQVNLIHEAENMERFAEGFTNVPVIKFARPIPPFITEDVLIETFEEGNHIQDVILNDELDVDYKKKLGEIGADAVLKMVFVNNFVHGDLHPGNILVQNAEQDDKSEKLATRMVDMMDKLVSRIKAPTPTKLVILDCSLSSSLTYEDYKKFTGVIKAVILGKGEEVADLFLKHSEHECNNPEGFKSDMKKLVSAAWHNTISLGTLNLSELMPSVFLLLSTYHVRLESNFVSIILAMMVVEGLGRSLDPSLDLMEKAKKFILA